MLQPARRLSKLVPESRESRRSVSLQAAALRHAMSSALAFGCGGVDGHAPPAAVAAPPTPSGCAAGAAHGWETGSVPYDDASEEAFAARLFGPWG